MGMEDDKQQNNHVPFRPHDAARHIHPAFASGRINTRADRCFTKAHGTPDDGEVMFLTCQRWKVYIWTRKKKMEDYPTGGRRNEIIADAGSTPAASTIFI